jgi:hypothetical protein
MSSYIPSPKHFNSVQKALVDLFTGHDFEGPYALREKLPRLFVTGTVEAEVEKVVDDLRKLNVLCVTLQYAHHYEGHVNEEIKEETSHLMDNKNNYKYLSVHGLYNALNCISYQIEVEHLTEPLTGDEQNAMFFLAKMRESLAYHLVRKMPEDKTCRWEVE